MNFAFRVDSSSLIGAGHVVRCLSLATALREHGAECMFVCRNLDGNLMPLIREKGFSGVLLPGTDGIPGWAKDAEETKAAITGRSMDWVVVDHYGLDAAWEQFLRQTGARLLAIDDIANRPHDCDLLLDQNLPDKTAAYRKLVPETCGMMIGPHYALLDRSYSEARPSARQRSGPVKRVLVYFGGGRHGALMKSVLEAISHINPDIVVDAVIGQSDTVIPTDALANLRYHAKLPTLAPLMAEADLAIGASGTSNWERCCLGLPSAVVTVAENQEPVAEALERSGIVVNLGRAEHLGTEDFVALLSPLLTEPLDAGWSDRCHALVDGEGARRSAGYLLLDRNTPLRLRPAKAADEELLLRWANDDLTRRVSLNPKPITPDEHHRWFSRRLAIPGDCTILVAETASGLPVGQVRFERREESWEISFNLDPLCRGRGVGIRTVQMAVEAFLGRRPDARLSGQVKIANAPSRAIFRRLGFQEAYRSDGVLTYVNSKP